MVLMKSGIEKFTQTAVVTQSLKGWNKKNRRKLGY
jgi:hypothetical protein